MSNDVHPAAAPQHNAQTAIKAIGKKVLILWLLASAIIAIWIGTLVFADGPRAMLRIMGRGDGTPHAFRLAVFAIGWSWITLVLLLSQAPAFARRHAVFAVVLVLLGFEYLNMVREPHRAGVGDFPVYYEAAVSMSRSEPIQGRAHAQIAAGSELQPGNLYIYPPLLAATLSPLVFLSEEGLGYVFHLANYFGVIMLAVLLYWILPRYGISREVAGIGLVLLLAINVPISRTLIYHQVNVFVFDLMLLGLYFFPRSCFLSALSLTLAMHLKVYPALLVIPFIAARQWRWLAWCAASQVLILGATSVLTDPRYYLDFIGQLGSLRETGLRNTAPGVFIANTFRIFGIQRPVLETILSFAMRLGLLAAFTVAAVRIVRRRLLDTGSGPAGIVLGGYALVPIAMLLVSPSVWEHHYVLLILSFPIVATLLRTPGETGTLLMAWAFVFVLPVVELYPFSYLPLLAMALLVGLLWVLAHRPRGDRPGWYRGNPLRLS